MTEPVKSRAVVLHSVKYGDSSLIVNVLDAVRGRISLMLRGIGRKPSVTASQLFCLNVIDYVAAGPPHGSLLYLREYRPAADLSMLRRDISKSAISIYIGELLYRCLREGDGSQDLFGWICGAVGTLNALESDYANFHLWFTLEFCRCLGFAPGGNPDLAGVFSKENSALLGAMSGKSLAEVLAIPLSGARRHSFVTEAVKYLSESMDVPLDIKSLGVLHEVF